ncbi:hypothetical protein BC628DRAFT_1417253 [Trametes gibbosa]|nr:hypothetical protein BC628DRAFT_1417253 [Trametes gibbosa]
MLARLSVSATSHLARGTPSTLQRLASQARFNSSDAASPAEPAPDADAAPKKRAIPLADSLGDITITNRPRGGGGPRRNGDSVNGTGNGNGNGTRDYNRPRSNNFNSRDGNGNDNRANAGARRQNNGNGNGNGNGQRSARQDGRGQGQQQSAQYNGAPRQQHNRRDDRRPRRSNSEGEEGEEEVPFVIPPQRKIELGNLEDFFGPPTAASGAPHVAITAGTKSPSQERVQALIERTAGDYSRFIAKPLPSTDVRTLSPLELSAFVLSKRRDVTLQSRQNALAVVGKFPETKVVAQGASSA